MECNSLHRVFSTFFIFVLHLLKYTTFQIQLQNIKKKYLKKFKKFKKKFKKKWETIKIRHPGSVPNPSSSNFSKLTWETHPYTYDNVETLIALFKIRNQKKHCSLRGMSSILHALLSMNELRTGLGGQAESRRECKVLTRHELDTRVADGGDK